MQWQTVELLDATARANLEDPYRHGNLIRLPSQGRLIITGDLHGHARNLQRIITYADLSKRADTHLILHEIIHGGQQDVDGGCLSYRVLLEAAVLKVRFPDRVHVLMGNHDTAFITASEVLREGRQMNRAMLQAVRAEFGPEWEQVAVAIRQLLLSQPLATRTSNRIWISHSLPSDRTFGQFDLTVLSRPLQQQDLHRGGAAYALTWGRHIGPQTRQQLAQALGVDLFVVGHQAQPEGWHKVEPDMLIIASDHNHGCILELDLAAYYDLDHLALAIVPLSSIS